jgi:hypothetical protein
MSLSDNLPKAKQYIEAGDSLIIDGATGSGKSFLVLQLKLVLKEYTFIDVLSEVPLDAPNFFSVLESVSAGIHSNFIYVIDPFDNVSYPDWMKFQKITEKTDAQFIIVLGDSWKIPGKIVEKFKKISCKPTLKNVKADLDVSVASTDYRSTILASSVGSDLLDDDGIFDRVRKVFEGSNFDIRDDELPWLFDNASGIYSGRELLEALKSIELFADDVPALNCLKPVTLRFGQISYPSYYRARSRRKYDDDGDEE